MRGEFYDVGEDGRLHDLEVLFVLRGGAGGYFVEPLAGMRFIDATEASEGGEELVVTADAGAGDEAAHGEGVDEGVIEMLVFEGTLGADIALAADRLWRQAASGAYVFGKAECGGVDAEEIGSGILDEGFGIDCAGEMHVQVRSFGHADEEGVELERALSGNVESMNGALFMR